MDLDHSFQAIEQVIWADPAQRGVHFLALPGELGRAAKSLFAASRVAIVTGFFIVDQKTFETDGPPGARAIGRALESLQIPVEFLTDSFGVSTLQKAGLQPVGKTFHAGSLPQKLTHLIAVERLGRAVDERYYSMRGRDITEVTEPLDQLFLDANSQDIVTIGIGDGGNEIGMGKIRDHVISNISHGATISSIVPTDFLISSGTSNWGAWGLVAGLSLLARHDLLPDVEEARDDLRQAIDAGCCDGVTGRREMTVDGLTVEVYLDPLQKLRDLVHASLHS